MDNYKDKYDNIVSKLLELVKKEQQLDKVEEEIELNLEKKNVCNEEYIKLVGKLYEMKHEVISKKSCKCMSRALIFSLISGLALVYVWVNLVSSFWIVILYIILNIVAHRNMYLKKINDKNYMLGELESSLEYKNLIDQINNKKEELDQFRTEDERLMNELSVLHSETQYLYTMIYAFVDDEEIQRGIDVALKKGKEREIEYAQNNRLVRRRGIGHCRR